MPQLLTSGIIALLLTAVHLFAGALKFLDVVPRSRWLSAAGGVSVAYVFVHLLPELSEARRSLVETDRTWLATPELDVYLIALAGLVSYYALERTVKGRRRGRGGEVATGDATFRLHVGFFALYNALIGYTVASSAEAHIWFGVAMALHFLVTDYGLQQDHPGAYARVGRWLVSAAIIAGWLAGLFVKLPEAAPHLVTAFLGGSIILNVMKEELPEERDSRLLPFVAGAAGYAALLIAA